MAVFTTDLTTPAFEAGMLTRLREWMTAAIERQHLRLSRRAQIEALEVRTDAELAEMGLSRERIVHHVFRDLYYI